MDLLANQTNFRSLSLKDLLEARDLYHWHLMNKANVVGTAIGLYLIRKTESWPHDREAGVARSRPQDRPARTLENSEVRPYSWPCVLVFVRDWVEATAFGGGGLDPDHMVPRTLYLPDGRAIPVCVVAVEAAAALMNAPVSTRWPDTYIGGGCPLVVETQGVERMASVGCLVTDGHLTYALTNRHVAGEVGSPVQARVRGALRRVGKASARQLGQRPFTDVFPEFPGRRTTLALDIGLIEVDQSNDWTSQVFGLKDRVGDVADLNELNLGLQLIDQPVEAFGAASGALEGTIKALFYRHKALAGYDYVSEFLIAPRDGGAQTAPGDSGTIWHLRTTVAERDRQPRVVLRPMAVQWGGQTFAGDDRRRLNFALATGLSTACRLLQVDLVSQHNVGASPYWGQVGHYSIATAAVDLVGHAELRGFLAANLERISFRPDDLSADQIKEKLANGAFVELADVPDLVWKKVAADVPGGRDFARNAGPEHPTHYADIDLPGQDGTTLRDLTLADIANMDVQVWRDWYEANGRVPARSQGLLPFRVWQFFDAMVGAVRQQSADRFLCAAGIVSHYLGDACQPLHGSFLADGRKDPDQPDARKWPGKGVHAAYEAKMVDRHAAALQPAIAPAAEAFDRGTIAPIREGRDAGYAVVQLMAKAADILPPAELVDEYIRLGGGASARVVDGLWDAFGERTADLMGAGACYLAAIWDAAFEAGGAVLPKGAGEIDEADLAVIYKDPQFVPSLTLDRIGAVLERGAGTVSSAKKPRAGRVRRAPPRPSHERPEP